MNLKKQQSKVEQMQQKQVKTGVKFAQQQGLGNLEAEESEEKKVTYKDWKTCRNEVIKIFNEADQHFKLYTHQDPQIKRKDTAQALIQILNNLKNALEMMNIGTYEYKLKNYYLHF